MTREELSKKVDEFVNKYKGQQKGYPTDSNYFGECLSIVKLCIKEIFGVDAPPSGSNSAYGYWINFPNPLPTFFEKVQNTLTRVPQKGDIIIWNTSVGGGYGHIAIFVSGDVNAFTSFDQNWNGRYAHLQVHDYTNVVGWLKVKTDNEPIPQPVITDQTKLNIGGVFGEMEFQKVRSTLFEQTEIIKTKTTELGKLKEDFENYKNGIEMAQKEAIAKAIAESDVKWQIQLESAKETIQAIYNQEFSKISYKILLSWGWKNFWAGKRG